jgi:nucleotide-binding universal stress UspA family protein
MTAAQTRQQLGPIKNILFPVDFSPSCEAMVPYVKRAAHIFGAAVSLIHVFDASTYNGFDLFLESPFDIAKAHEGAARKRIDLFLKDEFPAAEYPRILASGDPAAVIAQMARDQFDLIIMPTHARSFRRMLLGSTTAKVLNDADCPVLTSRHAETIAPRPLNHRTWLCAVDADDDAERIMRFAHTAAEAVVGEIFLVHAIPSAGQNSSLALNLKEDPQSQQAHRVLAGFQANVGLRAQLEIVVGPLKESLLEAARRLDADVIVLGRSAQPGALGRLRDLTYSIVRDSPCVVMSV